MDRLKPIESFVAVVAKRSLTAVANAEGVAPAVISRRVDALKERLGVKLLLRTTRRIALTHDGSAFLEDCQRVLTDLANAEAGVSAAASRRVAICESRRQPGSVDAMWHLWYPSSLRCTPTPAFH